MRTFPICRSHQKEGTVNTLEGRSVIKKQLCRLEEWAEKTPMRNTQQCTRLPREVVLSPSLEVSRMQNKPNLQSNPCSINKNVARTLDTITMNFPVRTCQRTPPVHSSLFYNGAYPTTQQTQTKNKQTPTTLNKTL